MFMTSAYSFAAVPFEFVHIGSDDERGAGVPGLFGAHAAKDRAGEEIGGVVGDLVAGGLALVGLRVAEQAHELLEVEFQPHHFGGEMMQQRRDSRWLLGSSRSVTGSRTPTPKMRFHMRLAMVMAKRGLSGEVIHLANWVRRSSSLFVCTPW
jgi:hypothetical protein